MATDHACNEVFVASLDHRVTVDVLRELMEWAGPVADCRIPDGKTFGFVTFASEDGAAYAARVFHGVRLFGKPLTVAPQIKHADLVHVTVGNMHALDVTAVRDVFGVFGDVREVKPPATVVMYDQAAADTAVTMLNGQVLAGNVVRVALATPAAKRRRAGDPAAADAPDDGCGAAAPAPPAACEDLLRKVHAVVAHHQWWARHTRAVMGAAAPPGPPPAPPRPVLTPRPLHPRPPMVAPGLPVPWFTAGVHPLGQHFPMWPRPR